MLQIRPVSDLRNKFPDMEKIVNEGDLVYLTKNGYGAMVILSLVEYSNLTNDVEAVLDKTDRFAAGRIGNPNALMADLKNQHKVFAQSLLNLMCKNSKKTILKMNRHLLMKRKIKNIFNKLEMKNRFILLLF